MLQKMIQVFSLDLVKVMPAAQSLLKIMNQRKFLELFLEVWAVEKVLQVGILR